MPDARLLVTGFGPFRDVAFNPSGAIVEALAQRPPRGWRVSHAVLPVTFEGAPSAIDALLAELDAPPALMLGFGVHPGRSFRVERRARLAQESESVWRSTSLDVNAHALALSEAGGGAVTVSNDAGQYVCERAYHHLLLRADQLQIPALFLHVPPDHTLHHTQQATIVRRWIERF